MCSRLSFPETVPLKSGTPLAYFCSSTFPTGPSGVGQRYFGEYRRLHMCVLEPRMPLRRARLKKGVRAGRLQSTKAVWDSRSGLFCSGSDARRQLLMGSRASCQVRALREERKVLSGRTMKQRKKPESKILFIKKLAW